MSADLYAYGYDANKPGGWPAAWLTYDQMMQRTVWNKVHPEVRRRFKAAMDDARKEGVTLGVGGAWRSSAQQEATFRARYTTTYVPNSKSVVSWEGQTWYLKPGMAPSTPPNRSYHESSLDDFAFAIDSIGDWAWMRQPVKDASGKTVRRINLYGLVEFNDVNNEPWHVQPIEVPTARRNYTGAPLQVWKLPGEATPPKPGPEAGEGGVTVPSHIRQIAGGIRTTLLGVPGDQGLRSLKSLLSDVGRRVQLEHLFVVDGLGAGALDHVLSVVLSEGVVNGPDQVLYGKPRGLASGFQLDPGRVALRGEPQGVEHVTPLGPELLVPGRGRGNRVAGAHADGPALDTGTSALVYRLEAGHLTDEVPFHDGVLAAAAPLKELDGVRAPHVHPTDRTGDDVGLGQASS